MQTAVIQAHRKTPELEEIYATRDAESARERKEFEDFRDRAAYVYVTGTFPTHLRTFFTALLRKATKYNPEPVAFDKRGGRVAVIPDVVSTLGLDDHPMVQMVRDHVKEGWKIQQARSVTDRRPYSKVFMFKESGAGLGRGVQKKTIQADGSIKDGWA